MLLPTSGGLFPLANVEGAGIGAAANDSSEKRTRKGNVRTIGTSYCCADSSVLSLFLQVFLLLLRFSFQLSSSPIACFRFAVLITAAVVGVGNIMHRGFPDDRQCMYSSLRVVIENCVAKVKGCVVQMENKTSFARILSLNFPPRRISFLFF